jgi:hypothetical protein
VVIFQHVVVLHQAGSQTIILRHVFLSRPQPTIKHDGRRREDRYIRPMVRFARRTSNIQPKISHRVRRSLNRFLEHAGPFTDPDAVLGTPLQERLSTMKVLLVLPLVDCRR